MRLGRMLFRAAVGLALAAGFLMPAAAAAEAHRIGIAIDGPWERNDAIRTLFEQEILDLVRDEFDVRLPEDKRLVADWTLDGVKAVVDDLMADPDVDIVLAAGPISSTYACHLPDPGKPIIALFVFNTEIQRVPFANGRSGVANLNYVTFKHNVRGELEVFRRVAPFDRLAVLVSQGLYDAVPAVQEWYEQELAGLDLEVDYIRVAGSAEEALDALSPGVDAVYVGPLLQLTAGEYERFVSGLIERRLPSFAMWGRSEVERGLLASLYLAADFQRLGRRVALNIHRILLGEKPGDLPVYFRRGERLTINMATARAIGISPSWDTLTEAELLYEEPTGLERRLDLASAAREAVAANLDLATADRAVAAGAENVGRAESNLRPQLEIAAQGTVIDQDRAEASFGSVAERTLSGSLTLSQLVYSEPARSNVEIQSHLQAGREEDRERILLDIMLEATTAYINVLRAKTVERIQKDNLAVTRSNLELARNRQAIGVARPSEIYRWENRIADSRRAVIDATALRSVAEIALNRVLHRPLEELFATEEVDLEDPTIMRNPERMRPYFNDPWSWSVLRDFMVDEGVAASPELRELDAAIAAQERRLLSARRSFTHPSVALQGDIAARSESGAGSSFDPGAGLPIPLPVADDVDWMVGVRASLPLADGGARRAEERQAKEDLAALRLRRQSTAERVEQLIRSALQKTGASYTGIELAYDAAENADSNLQLVTDAYAGGAVSIIDLLDAQNSALVADLAAANAVHNFLTDMMAVERAIGSFALSLDTHEREAFYRRVEEHFEAAKSERIPR